MKKIISEGVLYHDKAWKETLMSRVEVLLDDGRTFQVETTDSFDSIMEYGRCYRITLEVEEIH